jgi:pimeloyl-ACP methyl ester carboxylesterase
MTPVTESQGGAPKRRFWRVIRWIGSGLAVLVLVLAIGGAAWNWLANLYYRHHYPVPGKMYTVNGFPMHMYCTGSGSPTLVLESGLGDDWTVWAKVQPTLSKTTQVCSYDRAGMGWSDEQSKDHDANTLADQLHALLPVVGIHKPIILMGHSIAGIYLRAYVARYPGDVAGLIFVDASSPHQDQLFMPLMSADLPKPHDTLQRWETFFGVTRARGDCSEVVPGLEFERGWIYANNCKVSVVDATIAETNAFDRSSDETQHTGPFGDLPILVFSSDSSVVINETHPGPFKPDAVNKVNAIWEGMQEDLKHLSRNSRRIIAKGSGHYVEVDRADLINREVPVFIQQVRSGTVAPDNGTTKVE